MARVTISIDPMPALRADAATKVNARFNAEAHANLHSDLVSIAAGKPDALNAREASRQQIMAHIDAAKSPAEIDTILKGQ